MQDLYLLDVVHIDAVSRVFIVDEDRCVFSDDECQEQKLEEFLSGMKVMHLVSRFDRTWCISWDTPSLGFADRKMQTILERITRIKSGTADISDYLAFERDVEFAIIEKYDCDASKLTPRLKRQIREMVKKTHHG